MLYHLFLWLHNSTPWLGALNVTSALIAPTVASALPLVYGLARSIRRIGIGRPDVRLGLSTLW